MLQHVRHDAARAQSRMGVHFQGIDVVFGYDEVRSGEALEAKAAVDQNSTFFQLGSRTGW